MAFKGKEQFRSGPVRPSEHPYGYGGAPPVRGREMSSPFELPGEEQPVESWQVKLNNFDVDKAREAYVGERYDKFVELFDGFDSHDGFRFSFLWPPLVFGWFWLFYRRVHFESFLLFVGYTFVLFLSPLVPGGLFVLWFIINIPFSMAAGWIYYHKMERQIETALTISSNEPVQAVGWLKLHGGTNPWVAVPAMIYLIIMLLTTS